MTFTGGVGVGSPFEPGVASGLEAGVDVGPGGWVESGVPFGVGAGVGSGVGGGVGVGFGVGAGGGGGGSLIVTVPPSAVAVKRRVSDASNVMSWAPTGNVVVNLWSTPFFQSVPPSSLMS
jgi:hypothetical protein